MKGNIWTVAVIAVFVSLIMAGPITAFDGATQSYSVSDESMTVDYTQPVPVDETAFAYNDTVSIDDNGNGAGTKITAGDDYDWNSTSGEVTFYNTTDTSSGETVYIDYAYEDHDETTSFVGALFGQLDIVIGLLLMMFGIGAAITIVGDFGIGGGGF